MGFGTLQKGQWGIRGFERLTMSRFQFYFILNIIEVFYFQRISMDANKTLKLLFQFDSIAHYQNILKDVIVLADFRVARASHT